MNLQMENNEEYRTDDLCDNFKNVTLGDCENLFIEESKITLIENGKITKFIYESRGVE